MMLYLVEQIKVNQLTDPLHYLSFSFCEDNKYQGI